MKYILLVACLVGLAVAHENKVQAEWDDLAADTPYTAESLRKFNDCMDGRWGDSAFEDLCKGWLK